MDLSRYRELSFWIRSEEREIAFRVIARTASVKSPITNKRSRKFRAFPHWTRVTVALDRLIGRRNRVEMLGLEIAPEEIRKAGVLYTDNWMLV
ncbi:MAG: hypothetical protein D6679_03960 [Candidatus Hydrogenedentota bacterium]|nr:MAG: hypothetical protein D6679_03960 [Candidatus Hydrogenedentota bacterium]